MEGIRRRRKNFITDTSASASKDVCHCFLVFLNMLNGSYTRNAAKFWKVDLHENNELMKHKQNASTMVLGQVCRDQCTEQNTNMTTRERVESGAIQTFGLFHLSSNTWWDGGS